MNCENSILCDVHKCKHNANGCRCSLEQVKITCGCGVNCTCCGSYSEKD